MWLLVAVSALVAAFPLWNLIWAFLGVHHVYPWQLKRFRAPQQAPFVIDVRTPAEYRLMRMESSVNRPDLLTGGQRLPFSADQPLVVACMTGHRSPFVARKLKRMGYRNVYNLAWGVLGWKLAGGKTVRSKQW
jgi:rhodanese-related sulfurtransferase